MTKRFQPGGGSQRGEDNDKDKQTKHNDKKALNRWFSTR